MNPPQNLYPFQRLRIPVDGGHEIHAVDEGPRSDKAFLFVHGNPTWSFFFRDPIARVSPEHRCVAPDHLGCGLSDKPQAGPYSLADHIDRLEAVVDHLGLRSIHLVLHDWGGAIGMGLAQRRPDAIKGICLLNTAAFFSPHIPSRIAICRWPWVGSFINRRLNGFARAAITMAVPGGHLLPEPVAQAYLAPYGNHHDRVAIDRFVQDIPMEKGHPTRPVLDAIEASLAQHGDKPLDIHWGEQDFCFNHHFLKRWREIWPKARIHHHPDGAHYLTETHGQLIASTLLERAGESLG